jgi:tetratricopeptide (TPR) repeat protein
VILLPQRREERLAGSIASGTPRVLVAPFRVAGSDPSLSYLRDGMVELLSTRLAGDSVAAAVDPGAVLSAWRAADAGNLTDREVAARAARRLGASHAVVGSVVGTPSKLVLSAALISAADMSVRSQTSVEGPADSLTALIDQLAARLLAAQAGEGERLSEYVTPSLPALRAFLAGQAAYREERYTDAVHHYEYALRRDSSFALAALQLALAADRLNDAEQHDRALALAWAAREELTERDRSHLEAFAGPRYPAPSSEAEQLAAWQRAVALAPDRADVWTELGERFFYHGALLGAADPHRRAAAAFRRALSLEPNLAAPRRVLILIAARSSDSTALARLASRAALRDSVGELAPFVRWRVALHRNDDAELRRIRRDFPQLDDANLRAIAVSSQFDAVGIDDGERALRVRRLRNMRAATLVDVLLGQHSLAVARGRPILALDFVEQLQELQPVSRAYLRLRVLDALYAEGDRAAAIAAAKTLERVVDLTRAPAVGDAEWLADVCVLEQWRVANGETRSTASAIQRLRTGPLPRVLVPVSANPLTCAELLDAALAVATQPQAALARVMQLDSLMLGGAAVSDAGSYAHLVVARLYDRLGERSRALAAIRRRPYLTGWPRYLIPALREEGRLAEVTGDTRGAIAAYSAYLTARTAPEESVASQVASVRASLAKLETRQRSAGSR